MTAQETLAYAFQMAAWKIERAKQHVTDTEAVIKWLVERDNYVLTPQRHPETGLYVCHIGPKGGGFPPDLPLRMGDAIHNLASTLDYLWSGLVHQAVPGRYLRAHFPCHEERQNVAAAIADASVDQAFPQAERLMLDVIKPWKDGNFNVWVVKRLDNADKHRLLLPTLAVTKFGKFIATSEDGSVVDLSNGTIQSNGDDFRIAFATPFKLNEDAEVTLEIFFGEIDLPPRQPVLETLVNLTDSVGQVVQAFRDTFL